MVKEKPIGFFYNGKPDEGFLLSSLKSLQDFFSKMNDYSFYENARELFDISCKLYVEEDYEYSEKYKGLQHNLLVIPETDLFQNFRGGIYCIKEDYYFYCEHNNDFYVSEVIDFKHFKQKFESLEKQFRAENVLI